MAWVLAASIILSTIAIAVSMKGGPGFEDPRASGLDDVQFPQASKDRIIPVVMGTRWINSPNVASYGDFDTDAIRE